MTVGRRAHWVRRLSPSRFALLLVAASCGDGPLTPSSVAGTYALAQAAAQPLPGVVFDGVIHDPSGASPDFHLIITATSGSLTLSSDGRYQHAVDLAPAIDGAPQPISRWRDHGQFSILGDSLHFTSEFIQNVRFDGSAAGGQVHVAQDLSGEGRSARYSFTRQ
jgi:hypothetical protein